MPATRCRRSRLGQRTPDFLTPAAWRLGSHRLGRSQDFSLRSLKALLPAPLLGHWNQPTSLLPIITYAPFFDRGLKYMVQFD